MGLESCHFGLEKGAYRTIHMGKASRSRYLELVDTMGCCVFVGEGGLEPFLHAGNGKS